MCNILTQILGKMVEKFLGTSFEGNIDEYIDKQQENFNECMRETIEIILSETDEFFYESEERKNTWEIVKKDVPREILFKCGLVSYARRYYKNKETGTCAYLADVACGIEKYSKVSSGMSLKLIEQAADTSYQKSSKIVLDGQVSKQTVMKKVRQIEDYELEKVERNETVTKIHLQADEDHISLQDGRKTIVKLVTLHEGTEKENRTRNALVNKISFTPMHKESNSKFWERICMEIEKRYGVREDLKIYIHGDGANWIKSGVEEIPGSEPVLDRFHLEKYIRKIHKGNRKYREQIIEYLLNMEYRLLRDFLNTLESNDEITEEESIEVYKYLSNNRLGIKNALTLGNDGKSCAEGLVSHILSERISSRPCGWSEKGVTSVSGIRVFSINGGKLKAENLIHQGEVLAEHQSKMLEQHFRRISEAEHNFNIREHYPRRSTNRWLKDIAGILCS